MNQQVILCQVAGKKHSMPMLIGQATDLLCSRLRVAPPVPDYGGPHETRTHPAASCRGVCCELPPVSEVHGTRPFQHGTDLTDHPGQFGA